MHIYDWYCNYKTNKSTSKNRDTSEECVVVVVLDR